MSSPELTAEESFLDINLEDTKDMVIVDDGVEAKVVLRDIKLKRANSGRRMVAMRLEVIEAGAFDTATIPDIYHNVMFPVSKDDLSKFPDLEEETPKQQNLRNLELKNIFTCFGIPPSNQGNLADYEGADAWVILAKEPESTDKKTGKLYPEKNSVKKWVGPA